MKRKRSLVVLVLLMVCISITAGVLKYTISEKATIRVSLFDLSAQLTNLESWEKWNTALFNKHHIVSVINEPDGKQSQATDSAGHIALRLTVINPAIFQLDQLVKNDSSLQVITIQSTEKGGFSNIQWLSKKSGFQWLFEKITGGDQISAQLNDLKKFAESTQGLYGFPIQSAKVTDHIICTKRAVMPTGDFQPHIKEMLSDMRQFLKLNHIVTAKDYYYVSYSSLLGGKSELAVGIPVKTESAPKDGVEFLKFPDGGNLLVGTYEGNPSGIKKLYAALDKYISDKRLAKVAQPMEKYTDDPETVNNKSAIKMQIIYPVY
jgi:effector-binding domain-containing protein